MNYNYSSRPSYSTQIKPRDKDQPQDTVSCIVWDKYRQDPSFITSSWDGYLRYYLMKSNNELEKAWQIFLQHPILCCDINENNIAFAGLASGDVVAVNMANSAIVHLGCHNAPVNGIFWIKQKLCLFTLGFDNLIKFWNIEDTNNNFCQLQVTLPLKTVTSSFDFPYLVIGSVQGSIALITFKNLPNYVSPQSEKDYIKTTIDKYSKFICCRVNAECKRVALGTVDGRCLNFTIRQSYSGLDIHQAVVSRSQKRELTRNVLYGQVDCVDVGCYDYEPFYLIGGTEDLGIYNLNKKIRIKALATSGSNIGAITAVRLNPKQDYVALATGTDWLKGIHELQTIKRPRICVMKLDTQDIKDAIRK